MTTTVYLVTLTIELAGFVEDRNMIVQAGDSHDAADLALTAAANENLRVVKCIVREPA